ncbi:hypothetical protein Bbelb_110390 [Branchiostoma belcheri]|nr:hypothetical protein Bbelb_110390 [Branchiostoma belcheri]
MSGHVTNPSYFISFVKRGDREKAHAWQLAIDAARTGGSTSGGTSISRQVEVLSNGGMDEEEEKQEQLEIGPRLQKLQACGCDAVAAVYNHNTKDVYVDGTPEGSRMMPNLAWDFGVCFGGPGSAVNNCGCDAVAAVYNHNTKDVYVDGTPEGSRMMPNLAWDFGVCFGGPGSADKPKDGTDGTKALKEEVMALLTEKWLLISRAEADALLYYLGRATQKSVDWGHEVFQILSTKEHNGAPFGLRGSEESKRQTFNFQRKARAYTCVEGQLRKKDKLVMIQEDFKEVMRLYHDGASHPGITAMKRKLSTVYDHYDAAKVAEYVNNCTVCRTYKASNTDIQHNQPISINRMFRRLGIDFTTIDFHDGTPKKRICLGLGDAQYRYQCGWTVAKVLLNLCLTLGIVWEELQSDNGSEFVSHVVRELMKALGVEIVLANPRSPTTGGRFERGIQTIKSKVAAFLAQSRMDSSANLTPQEVLQKALYDYNKNLCPVDVWYPLYKTRRHQMEAVNVDSSADLLTTYTDPPIFNSDDMEEALAEVSSVTEAPTVASLLAEGRIATRNEQVTHFVKAGDDGYLKLDIKERRAARTDRRQVGVRVLDVKRNMLSLEVLDDTGKQLAWYYRESQVRSPRLPQSLGWLPGESCMEHKADGQGKAEALSQQYDSVFTNENVGDIPSLGTSPYEDVPQVEVTLEGAPTTFSKKGDTLLIQWYQAFQSYMWMDVPHHLQTAFELGVVLMLVNALQRETLTLQVPADCPEDIQTYLKEITKFDLPCLSSDASGKLSARIVPVALTGFIWPQIKDSRLKELSVYLHVPASHKCSTFGLQRPMWKYWRCTVCNASCCMECAQKLQTGHLQHDHPPNLLEDIADTRGPNVQLQTGPLESTQEPRTGATDVQEVTLVAAVSTLDGKVSAKTVPGQKCCGCSKEPVCSSSNCNCRKAGKLCGTKCKCAKKHLDCKNKNGVEATSRSDAAVSSALTECSWRKVGLRELSQSIQQTGSRPDVLEQRAQTAGMKLRPPTPKDGNCFFWAISDQLKREALRQEGAEEMAQEDIRELVTSYIRDNPNTADGEPIASFIDTPGVSLEEYLIKMAENGVWADHIVVQATADLLRRTINIVSTAGDEDTCFIIVEPFDGNTGWLSRDSSSSAAPPRDSSSSAAPPRDSSSSAAPPRDSSSSAAPPRDSSSSAAPPRDSSSSAAPPRDSSSSAAPPRDSSSSAAPPRDSSSSAAPPRDSSSSAAPPRDSSSSAAPPRDSSSSAAPPRDSSSSAAPPRDSSSSAAPPRDSSSSAAPPRDSSSSAAPPRDSSSSAAPPRDSSSSDDDDEVSIRMSLDRLLGPEYVGDTPPVLADSPSDLVELQRRVHALANYSPDLLFGSCEERELEAYFDEVKPYLQKLARGEVPDNERHSMFFGHNEKGKSTRRDLYRKHSSGAFTEDQANFIANCIMKEVKIPLELPMRIEYQVMVLLPEALAAIYQKKKGIDTLEEARDYVWRAGFREKYKISLCCTEKRGGVSGGPPRGLQPQEARGDGAGKLQVILDRREEISVKQQVSSPVNADVDDSTAQSAEGLSSTAEELLTGVMTGLGEALQTGGEEVILSSQAPDADRNDTADEADVPAVCWPVGRQEEPRKSTAGGMLEVQQSVAEKLAGPSFSGLAHPVVGERNRCQPFLATGSGLSTRLQSCSFCCSDIHLALRGQAAQGDSPAGAEGRNRPVAGCWLLSNSVLVSNRAWAGPGLVELRDGRRILLVRRHVLNEGDREGSDRGDAASTSPTDAETREKVRSINYSDTGEVTVMGRKIKYNTSMRFEFNTMQMIYYCEAWDLDGSGESDNFGKRESRQGAAEHAIEHLLKRLRGKRII